MNETLRKRAKQKNAKLQTSNKPRYISIAERAKIEAELAASEESTEQVILEE